MKMKLNKNGFTLVELVIAFFVLGAAGTMLVAAFTTSTNIINRATLYKNENSSAAASVELGEETESLSPGIYTVTFEEVVNPIEIIYTKGSEGENHRTVYGQYYYGFADSNKNNAHLKYKEFIPNVFDYIEPDNPEGPETPEEP